MTTKLSPAQLALLKERQGRFIDTYKPGRKLMELGLIDGTETKSGGSFNWTINQAGEAILASPAFQVALSPGEMAFMTSVLDEAGEDVGQGTMVSFDHTEGRAVSGLAKKGLVVRHKGEVELTELGTTWLRNSAHLRVES